MRWNIRLLYKTIIFWNLDHYFYQRFNEKHVLFALGVSFHRRSRVGIYLFGLNVYETRIFDVSTNPNNHETIVCDKNEKKKTGRVRHFSFQIKWTSNNVCPRAGIGSDYDVCRNPCRWSFKLMCTTTNWFSSYSS